jgi:tetratricopeptide (TPR) repeat protein
MTLGDLAGIVALARAGAIDEAVRRFEAADVARDDPAASIVHGRLLKELGLRAAPEERRHLYREAAAAYQRSAELQPATYPLINAATLSLLSGDEAQARDLAQQVLRSIDEHPDEPETPYYRAATKAEALQLLGKDGEARTAFSEAIALAPRAWEDHAITLRQFRFILEVQGADLAWLDEHRPPRSLHFGGHMSFQPVAANRDELQSSIDAWLEDLNVGFGFGALAAGADIIIAEALVARGGELHAVLPGGVEGFAPASVDPMGAAWRRRFDALIERAETVRSVRPVGTRPNLATVGLADEIAMGAAVLNAARLESEAVQLLVLDGAVAPPSAAGGTIEAQRIWAAGNRRQHLIHAAREVAHSLALATDICVPNGAVLAVIAIAPPEAGTHFAIEPWLREVREVMAEAPVVPVASYWSEGLALAAYDNLPEAADLVWALTGKGQRVGADYCAATIFTDPLSDQARLQAEGTTAAVAAANSTPSGSACVTEDFAHALAARVPDARAAQYVGELDAQGGRPSLGLYALRR